MGYLCVVVSKKDHQKKIMMSTRSLRLGMRMALSRNLATTTVIPAQAAADPIQQLFADKVKDYAKKKAAAGGAMPDATKETIDALNMELEKVAQAYGGGGGINMTKFPDFKFTDPLVEDVPLK